MRTVVPHDLSRRRVQDSGRPKAAKREIFAIGPPRNSFSGCNASAYGGRAGIGDNVLPVGRVPDLHRAIVARGGDTLTIGRPRYIEYGSGMLCIGKDLTYCGCVLHLHGVIEP